MEFHMSQLCFSGLIFQLAESAMDKESLLKLGITAFALGVSIFIFYGPKIGPRRAKFGTGALLGLQNLGLTCFLNSLLQALASCPYFIEWLELRKGNGNVTDSLLILLKLLGYQKATDVDTLSPSDLISSLTKHGWTITSQEQDCHELFLLLMTTLEEEEHKASKVGLGMLSESLKDLSLITTRSKIKTDKIAAGDSPIRMTKIDLKSPTRSLCGDFKSIAPPFRGYLACQTQCTTCKMKSPMRYDKFDTLSLTLPSVGLFEGFTLKKLLDYFMRTEFIDDFICDFCNKDVPEHMPRKGSEATRTVRIGKLPKCLCFHISRTYMTPQGTAFKRDNYVDFPEYLRMEKYTLNYYLKENEVFCNRKKKLMDICDGLHPKNQIGWFNCGPNLEKVTINQKVNMAVENGEHNSKIDMIEGESTSERDSSTEAATSPMMSFKDSVLFLGQGEGPSDSTSLNGSLNDLPTAVDSTDSWVTPTASPTPHSVPANVNYSTYLSLFEICKVHEYRLKAVVEHRGSVDNGHFVTYRRGPIKSDIRHRFSDCSEENRWFFTSDRDVQESSLCDAVMSSAYMIFYERTTPLEGR